jgi:oxygen-independent coproporphyrinogen-3 oxidase
LARAFELLEGHGYSVRSAYAAVRDPRQGRFVYQEAQYHGADLLGTGVASFSYFNGVHYQNHTSLERYLGSVSDGRLPHARACVLGDEERLVREFVLQLKLGRVSARDFQEKFGVAIDQHFAVPLEACAKRGWVRSNDYGVELTRSGLLRVDRLIPAFYLPRHRSANYW